MPYGLQVGEVRDTHYAIPKCAGVEGRVISQGLRPESAATSTSTADRTRHWSIIAVGSH